MYKQVQSRIDLLKRSSFQTYKFYDIIINNILPEHSTDCKSNESCKINPFPLRKILFNRKSDQFNCFSEMQ